MGLSCEMVEREADQAFPSLLGMSLSLTQTWVTEDPITLQDSPPSVSDREASLVWSKKKPQPTNVYSYWMQRGNAHKCDVLFLHLWRNNSCDEEDLCTDVRSSLLEIAGKYVKAGLPQRKIIYLIKRTSRKGSESWRYNYKRPISVNPSLCSEEPHMVEPGRGQELSTETTQGFHK